MKWVKRCCWLAGWSIWLLLGFGLYRELPRDLGPVVCKQPLERFESPIGFVGGGPDLMTSELVMPRFGTVVRIRDAKSGAIKREVSVDGFSAMRLRATGSRILFDD